MTLLTSSDYPAIRAAIDARLDGTALTDAIIGMDIYLGAADREVKERVTTWSDVVSAGGDDLLRLKAAAVYLTAARLCYVVVRETALSAQTRDVSWSRAVYDPEERAAYLRSQAEKEIEEILEPSATAARRPKMFRLASGTRGK